MFDESDTTHFCHKTFHGMLALKKYYGVINFLLQPQAYYPPNNVTKHCKDEELPDTLLFVETFYQDFYQYYQYVFNG